MLDHDTYPIVLMPEAIRSIIQKYYDKQREISLNNKAVSNIVIPDLRYPTPQKLPFFIPKSLILRFLKIFKFIGYGAIGASVILSYPNVLLMMGALVIGIVLFKVAQGLISEEVHRIYKYHLHQARLIRRQNRKAHHSYVRNYIDYQKKAVINNFQFQQTAVTLFDNISVFCSQNTVRGEEKEEAQKGVSEASFKKHLNRFFPGYIIISEYFSIPDFAYGYTTDFALIHPTSGLSIDVEIDEPYDGKSKKPHHCQDDTRDSIRNNFFLERNWVVIRFSEYQVVSQPEACCKYIALVISNILGQTLPEHFSCIETLVKDKTWDIAKAKTLSMINYREKYLSEYNLFNQRKR